MSNLIDKIIELTKWPVALLVLFFLPAVFSSFNYFNFFTLKNAIFIGGFLSFIAFSTALDKEVKSSLQTFSHELTHAFFAVLTLHKVTSIRLHEQGGVMTFKGKGNWLILVAPYFFPLFLFVAIVALTIYSFFYPNSFLTTGYNPLLITFCFGILTGAHFDMIASQVHENQTDLHKLGLPFSLMFIIPVNGLVLGVLFAFNSKGYSGIIDYFNLLLKLTKNFIQ